MSTAHQIAQGGDQDLGLFRGADADLEALPRPWRIEPAQPDILL